MMVAVRWGMKDQFKITEMMVMRSLMSVLLVASTMIMMVSVNNNINKIFLLWKNLKSHHDTLISHNITASFHFLTFIFLHVHVDDSDDDDDDDDQV